MRTLACLIIFTISISAIAEDWSQWRGENRDAVLAPEEQVDKLPSGKINLKWSIPIGSGYSGPTVADGRVYVTDRGARDKNGELVSEREVERVICIDAKTGEPIWEHKYDAKYTISYKAGPRASVTINQGRAFAVGAMGHFHCLNARTGEVIWARDLNDEYDIRMPIWGITASPLIYEDLVIQIVSGRENACVVAFDIESGKERWRSLNQRAGYSSPILIKQGGKDVLVCWTGESLSGLSPETGEVYWQFEMLPQKMPIGVPTPVVKDDMIFVSSFYDGSMLIRFDKSKPNAELVWRRVGESEKNTDALHCMISNPIIKGDHIYGVDSYGELRCLDLLTGDRVWETDEAVRRNRWATIHTIRNGDRELMVNEQGQLIDATLTPQGYQEHSRGQLISPTRIQLNRRDGVVWSHPAVANGHIFARNDYSLVCADLNE